MGKPNKTEKISKSQFQVMINSGHRYTGLLEKIGYVYWTEEDIYFVKLYPFRNGSFINYYNTPQPKGLNLIMNVREKPFFQGVSSFKVSDYRWQGYEVVTKKKHNLKVISLDALEYTNKDLYRQYYGGVEPIKNDNIPKPSNSRVQTGNASPKVRILDKVVAAANVGKAIHEQVDLSIDILESLEVAGKKIPYIGESLMALSLISDLSNGDYYSVMGELITSMTGWYGLAWEVGKAIYESENFIIQQYKEKKNEYDYIYNEIQQTINKGKSVQNSQYKQQKKALKELDDAYIRYIKLMKTKGYQ